MSRVPIPNLPRLSLATFTPRLQAARFSRGVNVASESLGRFGIGSLDRHVYALRVHQSHRGDPVIVFRLPGECLIEIEAFRGRLNVSQRDKSIRTCRTSRDPVAKCQAQG